MFDSVSDGREPTDEDGQRLKENILRCLLGNEPTRLALCRKYFSMRDLLYIKNREIGTGCVGGKAAGMLLARNILRIFFTERRHVSGSGAASEKKHRIKSKEIP